MPALNDTAPRALRRRRALPAVAAAAALSVTACLASCSSTTKDGVSAAERPSQASSRRAGSTGPVRVAFEVDNRSDAPNLPVPKPKDSPQGKAVLKFVREYDAHLPPGGRPIEAALIGSNDLLDSWASNTLKCSVVLPKSAPAPDVFIPSQTQLALKSLACFLNAGTIVLVGQSAIVPTSWLEKTRGAFLVRGTTYSRWAQAVGKALDDEGDSPPKKVVVMGEKTSITLDEALIRSAYREVVSGLEGPGRTVTTFYSPPVTQDLASTDAAFALVPTQLRKIGVDALVLPGILIDPLPAEALAKQKLTPPAFAAPDALSTMDGYPVDRLRALPLPSLEIDAQAAAVRLRTELPKTTAGKECLGKIDANGTRVVPDLLPPLVMFCDTLNVLERAVAARPNALESAQTFSAALRSLEPVELSDGTLANFKAQQQLGSADLRMAAGNARCGCVVPAGKSYPAGP